MTACCLSPRDSGNRRDRGQEGETPMELEWASYPCQQTPFRQLNWSQPEFVLCERNDDGTEYSQDSLLSCGGGSKTGSRIECLRTSFQARKHDCRENPQSIVYHTPVEKLA